MGAFKLNYRDYFYCTKKCTKANHLGNVLTLFTDKKIPVGTGTTVSYYKADLVSSMDYSPFGAPLKGRTFNGSGSRYGFNGQEKDNEIAGAGNSMTAEFWQYDARLGRRWNVDPVIKPWESSYGTFADNPILYVDPDGNTEFFWKGKWKGTDGVDNNLLATVNSKSLKKEISKAAKAGLNFKDYNLCNGDANANFKVISSDVLQESYNIFKKAASTKDNVLTEHVAVLKDNGGGCYEKTYESSTGKKIISSDGSVRSSGGTTPEGDVRIHSHPLGNQLEGDLGTSFDASSPTTCDKKAGGDMCADSEYKMNIIVGKNGVIQPSRNSNGDWEMKDQRESAINVFDSASKLKFSLDISTVELMLSGSKNQQRKDSFSQKQKTKNSN